MARHREPDSAAPADLCLLRTLCAVAAALGSKAGGKADAIACTLIETAKLNAVDPHARLDDTLASIPDYKIIKVDDLLPWQWNG